MSWYAKWFGREYLSLYPHRDQAEARQNVELVLKNCELERGSTRILDVACGNGRHILEFGEKGFNVVGVDLSQELLDAAAEKLRAEQIPQSSREFSFASGAQAELIRADMRTLPFQDAAFQMLTSWFTSFGYFPSDEEHQKLLEEWHRVLTPGGTLVIDYLNRDYLLTHLIPRSEKEDSGKKVIQERSVSEDGLRINKVITIYKEGEKDPLVFYESVRMYDKEELFAMLEKLVSK